MHLKLKFFNGTFELIGKLNVVTLCFKGKACVQWIFSLDTARFGHVSKIQRVQWKNSLDTSLAHVLITPSGIIY